MITSLGSSLASSAAAPSSEPVSAAATAPVEKIVYDSSIPQPIELTDAEKTMLTPIEEDEWQHLDAQSTQFYKQLNLNGRFVKIDISGSRGGLRGRFVAPGLGFPGLRFPFKIIKVGLFRSALLPFAEINVPTAVVQVEEFGAKIYHYYKYFNKKVFDVQGCDDSFRRTTGRLDKECFYLQQCINALHQTAWVGPRINSDPRESKTEGKFQAEKDEAVPSSDRH